MYIKFGVGGMNILLSSMTLNFGVVQYDKYKVQQNKGCNNLITKQEKNIFFHVTPMKHYKLPKRNPIDTCNKKNANKKQHEILAKVTK